MYETSAKVSYKKNNRVNIAVLKTVYTVMEIMSKRNTTGKRIFFFMDDA